MGQKKLIRFAAIKTFANVLEYPENMQGKWNTFFKNNNPIVLELACGRGEYTVGLSRMFADKNFIGVDIKGNRIFIGAKKCLDEQLHNAAFLRTQIEKLADYFSEDEVSEIWLTFPDPQLRTSRAKKRLTHPRFLRLYQKVLSTKGCIHLKTDSPDLYTFTKRVIDMYGLTLLEDCDDVNAKSNKEELKIITHYQSLDIAKSNKIFYLKFQLPEVIADMDEQLQEILKREEPNNETDQEERFSNEDDLIVFTAEYLLERGYCCGNGCRNCPYEYKNVPEPKRSKLLAIQQASK
ncbi:tRNA (guanosine(46)-N7)-methyltransferase TrmB [Ferruginibacter lapsinanis]|uniref:tRNA (guanosine(46)-N7)-methyltransferase TrmB n=1 Tax=Ferruginibacter lapsinanis TaxID=563172 RepID=UPI001E57692F|nr:tRNA (guanosine(46)-N7)-methyltransferase TrmB [Ferruginibacter lapsinanis]UEG50686.1 tRNA (guanosine(46)-N7)-methyltransferase TrmB [Ferruginibacter lapsinanis]